MLTEHFIHIHVPKTGGQFIRGMIHERDVVGAIKVFHEGTHMTLNKSKEKIKEYMDKDVPSFCFVRNPWSWYVSRFFFRNKIIKTINPVEPDLFPPTIKGFHQHMELLQKAYDSKEYKKWGRTYQYITLNEYHNYLVCDGVDFIGKLENFSKDLINILNTIAPQSFPTEWVKEKINKKTNVSKHLHYSKYYTDELINLVSEWDREYIEKFDYKFTIEG